MLIPRLHFRITSHMPSAIMDEVKSACAASVPAIYVALDHLSTKDQIPTAQEIKKICLLTESKLLLNDVKVAAIVNADGVILPHDDYNHGQAKDILGANKLVGATAHRIDDVAEYWEEGMADFIILESYIESNLCVNILGKLQTQTILDDAKIMGYNIPILIAGGMQSENAKEVLDMGCYGVQVQQIEHLEFVLDYLQFNPLR